MYRCNNELSSEDNYCSKCGSKVIKYSSNNKKIVRKYKSRTNKDDFFNFSLGCIITKFLSIFLVLLFPINIFIPWLLISIIFSLIGLIKFHDKRNIFLIVLDVIFIIIEILIIYSLFYLIFHF